MKTAIYKAEISTPYGRFIVAVDTIESGAKSDIISAFISDSKCHVGQIRVGEIKKSSRKLVADKQLVKGTNWAWIMRA